METTAVGIAAFALLVGGLIWQARSAGDGARAKGDLRALGKAVQRVEAARRKATTRGRDLLAKLRGKSN